MSSYSNFPSPPGTSQYGPNDFITPPPHSSGSSHRPDSGRRKKKKHSGNAGSDALSLPGQILQGLAIVGVAWVVSTAGFKSVDWMQQKLKPFCDSNTVSSDDCIPCPENGLCQDGRLDCVVGFRRVGKSCIEDKEIDQAAEKLVGYLRDHVCGLSAIALCDGASGAVWVTDAEAQDRLKEVASQEQFGSDGPAWMLVWEKTARIAGDSLVTQFNFQGIEEFRCPVELTQSYKPIKCRIKERIIANLGTLFIFFPAVVLVALSITRYANRKKTYSRAEEVYFQVCEALEEKALEARELTGGESWVVVSRLRDHVLLRSERKWTALWVQVEALVREDSRIDQYQKRVKGEMKVVWEWQVEGALRTTGLRKKVRPQAGVKNDSPQQPSQSDRTPQPI